MGMLRRVSLGIVDRFRGLGKIRVAFGYAQATRMTGVGNNNYYFCGAGSAANFFRLIAVSM